MNRFYFFHQHKVINPREGSRGFLFFVLPIDSLWGLQASNHLANPSVYFMVFLPVKTNRFVALLT